MPITEPTPEFGDIVDPDWMVEVEDSIRALEAAAINLGVTRSATQSITSGVTTYLTWTVEDVDTHALITAPSDTVTIPAGGGGLYSLSLFARFAANAVSFRKIGLEISGTEYCEWRGNANTVGSQPTSMAISLNGQRLAAGDTIKCPVFQLSGGALNIEVTMPPRLQLVRIAP